MKFSLHEAQRYVDFHTRIDQINLAGTKRIDMCSEREILAHAILMFMNQGFSEEFLDTFYGYLQVEELGDDVYSFSCNNKTVEFKDIRNLNKKFGVVFEPHKCHLNCLFATVLINEECLVKTVEIDASDFSKQQVPGILHSFVDCGENVLDFTFNLSMRAKDYYEIFNVKVLATNKASDLKADYLDGTVLRIVNNHEQMNLATYLLAREECIEYFGEQKNKTH